MILVIIGITILLFGLAIWNYWENTILISVGAFIVEIILLIMLIVEVSINIKTIDPKIKMYSEENQIIENKVKETVRSYMNYEENTYKQLVENADLTTLVIKYSELNSNELVKTEINLYVENNKKIKELKEEKIKLQPLKWWLYFGK